MKKMLSSLLAVVLLSGCMGDEFNTDLLIDDVNTNAGIAIPLAKSRVTMEDILSDQTDMVRYDGDNIILFQENDSLEYVGINDFFRVSATAVSLSVPFTVFNGQEVYSASEDLSFSIPDAEVYEMELNYQISAAANDLEEPLLVTLTLPAENSGSGERIIELEVYNNQVTTKSFAGDRFLLNTDNALPVQVSVKPLYGNGYYGNTIGNLTLVFDELSLNYVRGKMTENQVTMDEGSYELDFDVLQDIPGDIEFANPKLSIILDNATPFKGEVNTNLNGQLKDGSTIALSSVPFDIEGVSGNEQTKRTRYVLTNDNSNINSFIAKTPELLTYAGLLTLNPGSEYAGDVELTSDDRIYIGYGFEVPLELRLDALMDEEIVDLGDIDMLDDLTKGALIFTSVNGLPIGASATIKFYDKESASVIETMEVDIVEPAVVDAATGKVSEEVEHINEVTLSASQIESLKAADELHVTVRLNTSDYEKGQMVVFQRQNALEIQLAIRGKVEYNN